MVLIKAFPSLCCHLIFLFISCIHLVIIGTLFMHSYHFYRFLYQSYKLDCCLTNSDAHVIGGSEDGSIFFWDLVDASVVSSFRAHSSVVKPVFLFHELWFSFQNVSDC